jgi:hypothetical protein
MHLLHLPARECGNERKRMITRGKVLRNHGILTEHATYTVTLNDNGRSQWRVSVCADEDLPVLLDAPMARRLADALSARSDRELAQSLRVVAEEADVKTRTQGR